MPVVIPPVVSPVVVPPVEATPVVAKEIIVKNKFYQIALNPSLNRVYLTIIGFWRTPQEVASYLPDLEKALRQLQPGFTLLTDLTGMKTHPAPVQAVHLAAQALLLRKGLRQTAEVTASSLVQFQTDTYAKNSKMPLRQFSSAEQAEAYLNTLR